MGEEDRALGNAQTGVRRRGSRGRAGNRRQDPTLWGVTGLGGGEVPGGTREEVSVTVPWRRGSGDVDTCTDLRTSQEVTPMAGEAGMERRVTPGTGSQLTAHRTVSCWGTSNFPRTVGRWLLTFCTSHPGEEEGVRGMGFPEWRR